MFSGVIAVLFTSLAVAGPAWDFDDAKVLAEWAPNAHMADIRVEQGSLRGRTIDWDPFFTNRSIEFQATPWQYVVIRLKASRSGEAELFWSNSFEGQYGGLSQEKCIRFKIAGSEDWQDIAIFPFWHSEGTIRQLRLDLYDDLEFEIARIAIEEWGGGAPPETGVYSWTFPDGDLSAWQVHPGSRDYFAPPLALPVSDKGWINLRLRSDRDGTGSVLWSSEKSRGGQHEDFVLYGDGQTHHYDIEVISYPSWSDPLVAFGLRLPESGVRVESIAIGDAPAGPPDFRVNYFGFENGVNRAGRKVRILAQLSNRGQMGTPPALNLVTPFEVKILEQVSSPSDLDFGETGEAIWEVTSEAPGPIRFRLEWASGDTAAETELTFLDPRPVEQADYVPEPRPVKSNVDLCMYYFPGWDADAKWDCIRRVAPVRKPLLGYYDEANPECVDWQIKWAVENGINCFLVDWYWIAGSQHLTHWFEAYRKARYRDYLEVAIMWANHNPPKTHSREDWRNVTREWIDRYFNLPAYYRLKGKPAIFLWDPETLRSDLGGSDEVRAALDESQAMAHAAGYEGIEFVAVNYNETPGRIRLLIDEGYAGTTNYHEWGKALDLSDTPLRAEFKDLADSMPETWAKRDAQSDALIYYPVLESGWDSRPWHGNKALAILGRTPALFEQILRDGKAFSAARDNRMLVIGPANEWGEGSYIEPNTEFGFDMYEAVRRVFGTGDPANWPENLSPEDVGLGPYDFPPLPRTTAWDFEDGAPGWSAMMGLGTMEVTEGILRAVTTSSDPAFMISIDGIQARQYPAAEIRMRMTGDTPGETNAQLFWSVGGSAITEATSINFPVKVDGQFHTYTLDLSERPRWRGRIATLRFDPGSKRDITIEIDRFALIER
jgi:hypothetical protein